MARLLPLLILLTFTACRQRESATPMSHEGDPTWPAPPADGAPVVLQQVRMTGSGKSLGAEMNAFNFTPKDIQGLMLELHYLDAAGKVLQTFPYSLVSPLVVAANGRATVQVGAFVPERTTAIRADVEHVTFKDGTFWQRK